MKLRQTHGGKIEMNKQSMVRPGVPHKDIKRMAAVFKPAHTVLATCKVKVVCYQPIFEQGTVVPGQLGRVVRLILEAADTNTGNDSTGGAVRNMQDDPTPPYPDSNSSGDAAPGRL